MRHSREVVTRQRGTAQSTRDQAIVRYGEACTAVDAFADAIAQLKAQLPQ